MSRTNLPFHTALLLALATAVAADPRAAATVREKARAVNTGGTMGCLEEIGTVPRTACELFEAGGASGSILAARATYGKGASRALYGNAKRFVSRERLDQILGHLFEEARRFARQPGDEVPPATKLFAFANTVATGPYSASGWAGIRYAVPGRAPDQLEVAFRVVGPGPGEQPALCGKLGVNLIHAAFYASRTPAELLPALMTEVGQRASIRALRASGTDFGAFDPAKLGLEIVLAGCGDHVLMTREGAADPADAFHGKAPLLYSGATAPATAALGPLLADERGVPTVTPVPLLAVPKRDPDRTGLLAAQTKALGGSRFCLLSRDPTPAALGEFLAGASRSPVLLEGTLAEARSWLDAKPPGVPSADLRWLVHAKAAELAGLSAALDAGRIIALDEGAAWVPPGRLGPLVDALGRAPVPAASVALYLVPATAAQAEASLTPGQVSALRKLVERQLVAYRPR